MTAFTAALSRGTDWSQAAKDLADQLVPLPEGANVGFLYATDGLADGLSSILTFLRQVTGVEDWVGTVGIGIICGPDGAFDEPAACAMVGALPDDMHRVIPPLRQGAGDMPKDLETWAKDHPVSLIVTHGDPLSGQTPALIQDLATETDGFLVGALTASRGPAPQIAGDTVNGGISGLMVANEVTAVTGLSQGCTPLGEHRMVTEASNNVIMSIDGLPALQVLKDDMGELLARDLQRAAGYVHAAFPVAGSDTRDYLVRNLMGVDVDRGWIAVGGEVAVGDPILFVRRDPQSAEQDLAEMVDGLKGRLQGQPKGGLYFSCVARGPGMFGDVASEMSIITDRLGDFPLVGFYGNGEISNARLYGYTGVLVLFS